MSDIKKKFKRLEEETKINEIKKLQPEEAVDSIQSVVETVQIPAIAENESINTTVDEKVVEELIVAKEEPPLKKKRAGLVQEIIISVSCRFDSNFF